MGGYNGFWLDPGLNVIRIDGVARSSIIIDPPNGRLPARTDAGKKRLAEINAAAKKFGEFDHPEMRPLADRCLVSFGSNAGPPMLPNYFYNNNYTIVQTKDHVMILTEMNHDARIIRMGATDARAVERAPVVRRFDRPLGRRHARGRDHQHSSDAARSDQHPVGVSRRVGEPQGDRAFHAHRPGHHPLPLHDGGSRRPSPRRSPASCRSIASTRWSTSTRATRATTR